MPILLGLDFETTGLDPQKDKIIEAGFCLWDTERGPLRMDSFIIRQDVELSPEIIKITGITQDMLEDGFHEKRLVEDIWYYATKAAYFVAHNAPFDREFLKKSLHRFPDLRVNADHVKWIDTKTDIPGHEGKRLIHAAAEEGMVNPFPHRALPDVLTMLTLLSKFDFAEIERNALAEKITLAIPSPNFDPERNEIIKGLGFRIWHKESKQWRRVVRDFEAAQVIADAAAQMFKVYVLEKEERKGE